MRVKIQGGNKDIAPKHDATWISSRPLIIRAEKQLQQIVISFQFQLQTSSYCAYYIIV